MQSKGSLKMKLINAFGLSGFIENQFIFKPPEPGYKIMHNATSNTFEFLPLNKMKQFKFQDFQLLKHRVLLVKDQEALCSCAVIHISCRSDKVILFSHGNASDLQDVFSFGFHLSELYAADVILYDYTGYGYSKGKFKPTEQGLTRDLTNILAYASKYYSRVFLWGFSLGTVPTVSVATKFKVSGIILQAPLASVGRVIDNRASFDSEYDSFNNAQKIQCVMCPVFIIHGAADTLIPISHAQMLMERCNQDCKLYTIEGAGHNDLSFYAESSNTELSEKLKEFFDSSRQKLEQRDELLELRSKLEIITTAKAPSASGSQYASQLETIKRRKQLMEEHEIGGCEFFCRKYG